eukprot:3842555-Pyramimonas_sp.AAC.1
MVTGGFQLLYDLGGRDDIHPIAATALDLVPVQRGSASTNYLFVDGSSFPTGPAGSGWAAAHVLANDDG